MLELFDDDGSIVMSLGGERAKSRMTKLGISRVEVYQLRSDTRKSNDAVKKGIASPLSDRPAPAVTAGSSPESREGKSKPEPGTKENPILPNNKIQGTPEKPVKAEIEITSNYTVRKVPATVYGTTAIIKSDSGYSVTHVPSGNNIVSNKYEPLTKKKAEVLAKALAKLNITERVPNSDQLDSMRETLMVQNGYTPSGARAVLGR